MSKYEVIGLVTGLVVFGTILLAAILAGRTDSIQSSG